MADSKITALTSISTSTDPANDPLVIVDVSDTSMAATGTTKKVTLNQLLGASGTATLASATITGDLTVDTSTLKVDSANNRVGIGTATPAAALDVQGSSLRLQVQSSSNGAYATWKYIGKNSTGTTVNFEQGLNIAADNAFELYDNQNTQLVSRYVSGVSGAHSWFLTGTTAMTLNSTGLGVGVSPSYKLDVLSTGVIAQFLRDLTVDTGIQLQADNSGSIIKCIGNQGLRFNVSSADAVTFDSSGNVGIGVTPSARFHSKAGAVTQGGIIETTGANALLSFADAGTSSYTRVQLGSSGNNLAAFINSVQAMTLDASGILAIGTVALGFTSSKSTYFSPVAGYWIGNHTTGTPSGDRYWGFGYGVNEVGSITQNGTTGVLYNITSDYRLKEQVQPLVGGLARVNALKPSVYKWKSDGSNGEGFLAHELAEVVPFAVSGEKDAVNEDGSIKSQGIDMSRVVPILVAAIQELAAEVNALKNA